MSLAILDSFLPSDLVSDIAVRVHHLNMMTILDHLNIIKALTLLDEVKDCNVKLGEYIRCVPVEAEILTTHKYKYRTLYRVFTREIKKIVMEWTDNDTKTDYLIGQMKWGAWVIVKTSIYVPPQNVFVDLQQFDPFVMSIAEIAEDIDNFIDALPTNIKASIARYAK